MIGVNRRRVIGGSSNAVKKTLLFESYPNAASQVITASAYDSTTKQFTASTPLSDSTLIDQEITVRLEITSFTRDNARPASYAKGLPWINSGGYDAKLTWVDENHFKLSNVSSNSGVYNLDAFRLIMNVVDNCIVIEKANVEVGATYEIEVIDALQTLPRKEDYVKHIGLSGFTGEQYATYLSVIGSSIKQQYNSHQQAKCNYNIVFIVVDDRIGMKLVGVNTDTFWSRFGNSTSFTRKDKDASAVYEFALPDANGARYFWGSNSVINVLGRFGKDTVVRLYKYE